MNIQEKLNLLHQIADTIRMDGDITTKDNKIEIRIAGFADQLLRKTTTFLGGNTKLRITEDAIPIIDSLISEIGNTTFKLLNPEQTRDLIEVKSFLALTYFGNSHMHPWSDLLINTPESSSITLSSFANSHQALIQRLKNNANALSPLNQVDAHTHRQFAEFFIKIIQNAIKEGEGERYHVEYLLLFLAEALSSEYFSVVMNPTLDSKTVHNELSAKLNLLKSQYEEVRNLNDGFYLMFGYLDHASTCAQKEAATHLKVALSLAQNEPMIVLSGALEGIDSMESNELKEALSSLIVALSKIPQITPNIMRVQSELIASLRFQALSDIKFDPNHLESTWSKKICIQLLDVKIKRVQDRVEYDLKRVGAHIDNLQIKIENLKKGIGLAVEINHQLLSFLDSSHSFERLEKNQETLKKLALQLDETEMELENFTSLFKSKGIGIGGIEIGVDNLFFNSNVKDFEMVIKMEKAPLGGHVESYTGIDRQVENLKERYNLLKTYQENLKEVLPDPLANFFD